MKKENFTVYHGTSFFFKSLNDIITLLFTKEKNPSHSIFRDPTTVLKEEIVEFYDNSIRDMYFVTDQKDEKEILSNKDRYYKKHIKFDNINEFIDKFIPNIKIEERLALSGTGIASNYKLDHMPIYQRFAMSVSLESKKSYVLSSEAVKEHSYDFARGLIKPIEEQYGDNDEILMSVFYNYLNIKGAIPDDVWDYVTKKYKNFIDNSYSFLYKIKIPKDLIDKVLYISLPFGYPLNIDPVKYLDNLENNNMKKIQKMILSPKIFDRIHTETQLIDAFYIYAESILGINVKKSINGISLYKDTPKYIEAFFQNYKPDTLPDIGQIQGRLYLKEFLKDKNYTKIHTTYEVYEDKSKLDKIGKQLFMKDYYTELSNFVNESLTYITSGIVERSEYPSRTLPKAWIFEERRSRSRSPKKRPNAPRRRSRSRSRTPPRLRLSLSTKKRPKAPRRRSRSRTPPRLTLSPKKKPNTARRRSRSRKYIEKTNF